MPEFLSPGVYIQEVDAGPRPIEGVSTSTAGAVGVTAFGPTSGKPVLVTSFAEFLRIFGPPIPEPVDPVLLRLAREKEGARWWQFALSIKGFFDNGGQRIFIKRVFSKRATASAAPFGRGMVSEVEKDAAATDTSLKLRHLIGIFEGKQVTVFNPALVGTFRVLAYDAVTRTIQLDRALGKPVTAGKTFVQIHPLQSAPATLTLRARALGKWGDDLQVQMRPMVGATASLLADPVNGGPPFTTTTLSSTLIWVIEVKTVGLANNDEVWIKGTKYTVKNLGPTGTTFEIEGIPPADVLAPEESRGEKLALRIGDEIKPQAEVSAGQKVIRLADASKLAVNDQLRVGGDIYTVEAISGSGVTVTSEFRKDVKTTTPVEKLKLIVSAGTRRWMTLTDPNSLARDAQFLFVPSGKTFRVDEVTPDGTIKFTPAIPLGLDWRSGQIEYPLATNVETTLGTAGDTLEISEVLRLKEGDFVKVDNRSTLHRLIAPPSASSGVGRIKVTPNIAPVDAGKSVQKIIRTTVADNTADWFVTVESAAGLRTGEKVLINDEEITLKGISGNELSFSVRRDAGDPWAQGTLVRRLRQAGTASADVVNVAGVGQLYPGAIVELDNSRQKDVATIVSLNGDAVKLSKPLTASYREGHKLRVVEAEIQARQVVKNQPVQEESFPNLRLADDKSPFFFVTAVKSGSSLVEVATPLGAGFPRDLSKLDEFPASPNGGFVPLTGGDDKLEELSVDDFVGEDRGSGKRTGIQALEDIDEISICLVPNVWAPTVHDALIQHCELLKDRFAILDPRDGLNIEQIRDVREGLDSKYAALYYPWLEVRDPAIGRNVQVAPSGHMAGIYARVDVERGVHKAPANEIIRGITKIADDITKREQDLLNPKGINALRFFPGRGNRVWGARTISSDSLWKYINVRRLFLFVEESIDEGTQFVVFEPNADPTWALVRDSVTNFLTTVWRSGALEGTTADQAFFVKCDRTTMSQDDIDNGRLICVIGIAPVKPAEFVIFRISQKTVESNSR
jgi:uncharacterized protein